MQEAAALNTAPPTASRPGQALPRRGLERLDLLLLALEAIDLNGAEAMLWTAEQLGFGVLFPNRVEFWKRRCTNPLRRTTRRDPLSTNEVDALIRIACAMADRLYPFLRALLSSVEPAAVSQERWGLFQERLTDLLRQRMNPRRGVVLTLLDPVAGQPLRRQLVQTLALAAGSGGVQRLRASLFDAAA